MVWLIGIVRNTHYAEKNSDQTQNAALNTKLVRLIVIIAMAIWLMLLGLKIHYGLLLWLIVMAYCY